MGRGSLSEEATFMLTLKEFEGEAMLRGNRICGPGERRDAVDPGEGDRDERKWGRCIHSLEAHLYELAIGRLQPYPW